NIVPDYAACRFRVRARDREYLRSTFERVLACAEGAARTTGARLEWREYAQPYDDYRHNVRLGEVFRANLRALGLEAGPDRSEIWASTDFGNVSQVVPGLHAFIQVAPAGTRIHSLEFARAAISPQAQQAAILGAKALALTTLDLLADPALMQQVRAEFAGTTPP
ncbi:MAG TPA: amidohydrolase, partial [Dehalococcoidia bacterium]|nr:amidohydrolase [Dehalococcoidia bacterium]